MQCLVSTLLGIKCNDSIYTHIHRYVCENVCTANHSCENLTRVRRHCEKLAIGVPNCHVQEQLLARCNSYLNLIDVPKRPLGPCMDLIALSMRFAVFVLVFRIVAV